jgi:hypothetical protein
MRPRKSEDDGSGGGLFRARLDQIIDMGHELVRFAGRDPRLAQRRVILFFWPMRARASRRKVAASKSLRSPMGMANLLVHHIDSETRRFGNLPRESSLQGLGITADCQAMVCHAQAGLPAV